MKGNAAKILWSHPPSPAHQLTALRFFSEEHRAQTFQYPIKLLLRNMVWFQLLKLQLISQWEG